MADTAFGNSAGLYGIPRLSNVDNVAGGAVKFSGTTLSVTDTTFRANDSFQGGALWVGGDLNANRVLFKGNTAAPGGGGGAVHLSGGGAAISNVACGGTRPTSLGHNIDAGGSCGLAAAGDRSETDPRVAGAR